MLKHFYIVFSGSIAFITEKLQTSEFDEILLTNLIKWKDNYLLTLCVNSTYISFQKCFHCLDIRISSF